MIWGGSQKNIEEREVLDLGSSRASYHVLEKHGEQKLERPLFGRSVFQQEKLNNEFSDVN